MILFTATRPGGAACILPVADACRTQGMSVEILCSGLAAQTAEKNKIAFSVVSEEAIDASVCDTLLLKYQPTLVISGLLGEWNSGLDLLMLRQADKRGIKTIAILDSWMNLYNRVYDERDNLFIPNIIAVPDEITMMDLVSIGVPKSRIAITGQPAFDEACNWKLPSKSQLRERFSIKRSEICIVFFSEPIFELNMNIGFNQYDSLDCLLTGIRQAGKAAVIIYKRHPILEKEMAVGHYDKIRVVRAMDDEPIENLMAVADIVGGISSTLLVKAYIAGIPVLLIHPLRSTQPLKSCILSRKGYLTPAQNSDDIQIALQYPRRLLGKVPFSFAGAACDNIIELVRQVAVQEES